VTIDNIACGEREALVDYLYGEGGRETRARVDAHLAQCAECRDALEGMRGVRAELATWTVPDDAGAGAAAAALVETSAVLKSRDAARRPWWAPGAMAAAAVILLAVAAAVANLEITYGSGGVSIRTGWSREPTVPQTATTGASSLPADAGRPLATPSGGSALAVSPWRDDLAALERRLRSESQASAATGPRNAALSVDSARLLQRVQELIEQSEQRQRRELAMRMVQMTRDFDMQRQTDLVRIQQGLGQLEGSSAADRQILNYLVRASQRQ
jgi:hypothetical protein